MNKEISLEAIKAYLIKRGCQDVKITDEVLSYTNEEEDKFLLNKSSETTYNLSLLLKFEGTFNVDILKTAAHVNNTIVCAKLIEVKHEGVDFFVLCVDQLVYKDKDLKDRLVDMEDILIAALEEIEKMVNAEKEDEDVKNRVLN